MGKRRAKKTYIERAVEAIQAASIQPGTVRQVVVRHDEWCRLLAGKGGCNCHPEIDIRPDESRN